MIQEMSEKKLMVVLRFSVDVLNLLLLDFFSLRVFCMFKGLFFLVLFSRFLNGFI